MRFARWVFLIAGVYGLLVTVPMYFTEARYGRDHPPAVTHPEFYYGFAGVTLAWQVLFVVVARDPRRLRPVMPVAVIEKLSFAVAGPLLFTMGRAPLVMAAAGAIDGVLMVLFVVAYVRTANARGDDA